MTHIFSFFLKIFYLLYHILNRTEDCYYVKDDNKGVFKIKVAENEAVTLPIQRTNYEMVYGVDNILSNMRNVTNINMQLYNNNLQITLSICKEGLGLFIDNIKTQFSIGYTSESLCTITISIAQLIAIQKLFGNCSDVQIKRGDNCICLKQRNSEKTLLIAGMLF